ncbi:MAG: hypothetical protein QM755_24205 [Luteolibacter sp.]
MPRLVSLLSDTQPPKRDPEVERKVKRFLESYNVDCIDPEGHVRYEIEHGMIVEDPATGQMVPKP